MGNKRKTKTQKRPAPRPSQVEEPKTPWLKYGAWAVGGVVVIVLLAMAFSGLAPTDAPEGIQDFPGLSRDHTDVPVAYEQDPPAGGPHAPVWANCGFYSFQVPNENGVHALEHGVVWLTYRPGLPEDQMDKLRDWGSQPKVLVSLYPTLEDDVVATVWGRQLRVSSFDEEVIDAFVITQKDGPTTPEPGASCSGGVGVPS